MSKNLPMLWHIPLSHFNEKVRWALDFKNIPVCTENLSSGVVVVKSAKDGV